MYKLILEMCALATGRYYMRVAVRQLFASGQGEFFLRFLFIFAAQMLKVSRTPGPTGQECYS